MREKCGLINVTRLETNRPDDCEPFFSICIPQYNRTDFLIKACETYTTQSFKNIEICISDDCSTDGKEEELIRFLRNTYLRFVYVRQGKNLRYDRNLRSVIALSKGRYVLLMGNDDGLSSPDVLQVLRDELVQHNGIAVAITNYRELSSNKVFRRVVSSGLLGKGEGTAAATFRNYGFLSGIIFDGPLARREATDICDGSEMYQMYLGTRLVAAGGGLFTIDRICVDKDLQVAGQLVDSYQRKPKTKGFPVEALPMERLFEVVAAGLKAGHPSGERERESNLVSVCSQLYRYTYPFWIVEYRRVQSWAYAFGVLLNLRPSKIAKAEPLSGAAKFRLWVIYSTMGIAALFIPIALFDAVRSRAYALAKRTKLSRAESASDSDGE